MTSCDKKVQSMESSTFVGCEPLVVDLVIDMSLLRIGIGWKANGPQKQIQAMRVVGLRTVKREYS